MTENFTNHSQPQYIFKRLHSSNAPSTTCDTRASSTNVNNTSYHHQATLAQAFLHLTKNTQIDRQVDCTGCYTTWQTHCVRLQQRIRKRRTLHRLSSSTYSHFNSRFFETVYILRVFFPISTSDIPIFFSLSMSNLFTPTYLFNKALPPSNKHSLNTLQQQRIDQTNLFLLYSNSCYSAKISSFARIANQELHSIPILTTQTQHHHTQQKYSRI